MKTRYLSRLQFRGLQKVGDAFIPGDSVFPSFSACGCAEHADKIFAEMPEGDRGDFLMLLAAFAFLPGIVIFWILKLIDLAARLPGGAGALFRMMRFGIKGVVTSLYYSGFVGAAYKGKTPNQLIGYEASVYTADLDSGAAHHEPAQQER